MGLRSNGTNHTGGVDRGCSCVPQIRPFIAFAIDLPWTPHLEWDFSNPEYAVAGTMLHRFEWIFARMAPIILAGSITGAVASRK